MQEKAAARIARYRDEVDMAAKTVAPFWFSQNESDAVLHKQRQEEQKEGTVSGSHRQDKTGTAGA